MKSILSKQEREELKSLKNDLVNPVKRFVGEVYTDTVGDAKAFYSRQAKQAGQTVKQVHRRTEEQMQVFAQKREAQQRQRKASLKRLAIALVGLALLGIVLISIALSARTGKTAPAQNPAGAVSTAALESGGAAAPGGESAAPADPLTP